MPRHVVVLLGLLAVSSGIRLSDAATCPSVVVNGVSAVCANHGTCDAASGDCTCDPGYTFSDCSIAYSARIKVSVVTEASEYALASQQPGDDEDGNQLEFMNELQASIAELAGVSTDTVVPFCDARVQTAECLKGAIDSNVGGEYKITEHMFGFKDGSTIETGTYFAEKKSGTQFAYEFQSNSGSSKARAANIASIATYLPNGITRKTDNWLNTCPTSESGTVCSDRGQCKAANGGLNSCSCYYGFQADDCAEVIDCSSHNCSHRGVCTRGGNCACDYGWMGESCSTRACPNMCSGHGECAANGECNCEVGWTMADCSQRSCNRLSSSGLEERVLSDFCSGNGFCDNGTCICDVFYEGEDCSISICPNLCSGHGSCEITTGSCTCAESWSSSDCSKPECPRFNGLECGGVDRGLCTTEGSGLSLRAFCSCLPGYSEDNCGKKECPKNCNGNGICQPSGDCVCDDGYSGSACDQFCPGYNKTTELNCNGNGECLDNSCLCDQGWVGSACDMRGCPGNCTGHGSCDLSTGNCLCEKGYSHSKLQNDCSFPPLCADGCSGHGDCIPSSSGKSGTCYCQYGWTHDSLTNKNCAKRMLGCPNNCTYQGDCVEDQGEQRCLCYDGYKGDDCSTEVFEAVYNGPYSGPLSGNVVVSFTVNGFLNKVMSGAFAIADISCLFGGREAVEVNYLEKTRTIECKAPPVTDPDTVFIVLAVPKMQFSTGNAAPFVYYEKPQVDEYIPSFAPEEGRSTVTVVGRNFVRNALGKQTFQCGFGTFADGIYSVVEATQINDYQVVCKAPPKIISEEVFIEVSINGVSFTNSQKPFKYYQISKVVPSCAPADGQPIDVQVFGKNLKDGHKYRCLFGDASTTSITAGSASELCKIHTCVDAKFDSDSVHCTYPGSKMPGLQLFVQVSLDGDTFTANENSVTVSLYTAPVVSSIMPLVGPMSGNVQVTISGSNFAKCCPNNAPDVPCVSPEVKCKFGAAGTVPGFRLNEKQITCTTSPSKQAFSNTFPVQVALNGRHFSDPNDVQYYYHDKVVVEKVTPNTGYTSPSGTLITVTGTNFRDVDTLVCVFASQESCGGVCARTQAKLVQDNEITCSTPKSIATGVLTVHISLIDGENPEALEQGVAFEVKEEPILQSIVPAVGSILGGLTVTITGSNFYGGSNPVCLFQGVSSVQPFDQEVQATFVSSSQITCSVPAAGGIITQDGSCLSEINARSAKISVALNGETFLKGPLDFGYYSVGNISPTNGPASGGTIILASIVGLENMLTLPTGSIRCQVGTQEVPGIYESVSARIRCNAVGATLSGTVPFSVSFDGVHFSNEIPFSFLASDTPISSAQTTANSLGGTLITISGNQFVSSNDLACRLKVNSIERTSPLVRWVSSSEIVCETPAMPQVGSTYTYTADLSISLNNQQFTSRIPLQMYSSPTVTSVSPKVKLNSQSTVVTLKATEFQNVGGGLLQCKFMPVGLSSAIVEDTLVVPASFVDSTTITCQAPAIPNFQGVLRVAVSHDGQTFSSESVFLEYYSQPIVTAISPAASYISGGATASVYGRNFPVSAEKTETFCLFGTEQSVAAVTKRGVGSVGEVFELTCMIPASASTEDGVVDLTVSFDNGNTRASSTVQFSYYVQRTDACPNNCMGGVTAEGQPFSTGECKVNTCDCTASYGFTGIDCAEPPIVVTAVSPSIILQDTKSATFVLGTPQFQGRPWAMVPSDWSCQLGQYSGTLSIVNKGGLVSEASCTVSGALSAGPLELQLRVDGQTTVVLPNAIQITSQSAPTLTAFEPVDTLQSSGPDALKLYGSSDSVDVAGKSVHTPIYTLKGTGLSVLLGDGAQLRLGSHNLDYSPITDVSPQTSPSHRKLYRVVDDSTVKVSFQSPMDAANGYSISVDIPEINRDAGNAFKLPSLVSVYDLCEDCDGSSVSPNSGPSSGGTKVAVTLNSPGTKMQGSELKNARCKFGRSLASAVAVEAQVAGGLEGYSVSCTAPELPIGQHRVWISFDSVVYVEAPGGFSAYAGISGLSAPESAAGPLAGGTIVTVTGNNFVKSASLSCKFGDVTGKACGNAAFVSSQMVLCPSPKSSGKGGQVTILVSNNGKDYPVAGPTFEYYAEIVLSRVSPNIGPTEGGTQITIQGSNFRSSAGLTVLFGDVKATSVRWVSDKTIIAVSPAVTGYSTVPITVSNEGTSYSPNPKNDLYSFRYYEELGLEVALGGTGASPVTGNAMVKLTFDVTGESPPFGLPVGYDPSQLRVQFVTESAVMTATRAQLKVKEITVFSPKSAKAGKAGIRISLDGGQHYSLSTVPFVYYITPYISLSPSLGPVTGGTNIAIKTGKATPLTPERSSDLAWKTLSTEAKCKFQFGSTVIVDAVYNEDEKNSAEWSCVSPAAAQGSYLVSFAVDGSTFSQASTFSYYQEVVQLGVSPEVGIQDGGTLVSVQIQGQIEATSTLGCAFKISVPSEMTYTTGYTRASYDETNDYSTVECRSPAIAKLSFPVQSIVSISLNGQQYAASGNSFYFHPLPNIERISPAAGPANGGSVVTLAGTGFFDAASINVNPQAECLFGVGQQVIKVPALLNSPFRTVCTSPKFTDALDQGSRTVFVSVTINGAEEESASPVKFEYVDSSITQIVPPEGPLSGNTDILVIGTGFIETDELSCFFSGQKSQLNDQTKRVQFINSTHLRCLSPVFTQIGSYEFAISVDGQNFESNAAVRFTYYSQPLLSNLMPNNGPLRGGTEVDVIGSNLRSVLGMKCQFGSITTPARQISSSLVRCTSPNMAGMAMREVGFEFLQNGQQHTKSSLTFTYYDSPVVSGVNPVIGPDRAVGSNAYGTRVAVTGTNFIKSESLRCKFGDVISDFPVDFVNSTLVYCYTTVSGAVPQLVPQNVSVGNNAQQFQTYAQYFTFYPAPIINSISSTSGMLEGGEVITITGNYFSTSGNLPTKLSCKFGDAPGVATPVSATEVLCTTPPSVAGKTVLVGVSLNGVDYSNAVEKFSFNSPAPLLALEVTPSAAAIHAKFDAMTDQGGYIGTGSIISCSSLFDESTVQLFGDNSQCMWKDARTFEVVTGTNPSYNLESNIKLNPSVIVRKLDEPSYATNTVISYRIRPPTIRPQPTSVIEAPEQIGLCDTSLLLDGSLSYGSGARVFSTMVWTVESVTIDGMDLTAVKKLQTELQAQFARYTDVQKELYLTIGSFNISGGMNPLPAGTYVFGLTLTNWLGGKNKALAQITKSENALPSLYLKGGNSVETNPFAELSLLAVGAGAPCGPQAGQPIHYQWDMVPAATKFSELKRESSSLSIPAFTLQAGTTYTLVCTIIQGINKDSDAATKNSVTTKIYTASTAPVIQNAGGEGFEWGVATSLTLDASGSYDRDISPSSRSYKDLVWNWKCLNDFGCPDIVQPAARIVVLPPYSLQVDVAYEFELSVSKALDPTKVSRKAIMVTGTTSPLPLVELLLNMPSYSTQVDAKAQVSFSGKGMTANAGQHLVQYTYSISPAIEGGIEMSMLAPAAGIIGGSLSTTENINWGIKAGTLVAGTEYTVTLSITDNEGNTGSSSVVFPVNTGPTSGNFAITPLEGTALTTGFSFDAADWTDVPSQTPLMYQFSYMGELDGTVRKVALGPPNHSRRKEGVLLPTGPLAGNKLEVILDVFNKDMAVASVSKFLTVYGLGSDENSVVQAEAKVKAEYNDMLSQHKYEDAKVLLSTMAEMLNAQFQNTGRRRLLQNSEQLSALRQQYIANLRDITEKGSRSLSALTSSAAALEALVNVPSEITEIAANNALILADSISSGDGDHKLEPAAVSSLAGAMNSLFAAMERYSSAVSSTEDDLIVQARIADASRTINKISARDSQNMFPNQSPVYRTFSRYKMATYRIPWTPLNPQNAPVVVSPCEGCTDTSTLPPTLLKNVKFAAASTSTIAVEVVRFETDMYRWSSKSMQLLSKAYRLTVSEFGALQPLEIKLASPDSCSSLNKEDRDQNCITVSIPVTDTVKNQVPDAQGLRYVATCVRWDKTDWVAFDKKGRERFCNAIGKNDIKCMEDSNQCCPAVSIGHNYECATSHLTDFSLQELQAGCDGVPLSTDLFPPKVLDVCGRCDGGDMSCKGCDGIANSGREFDACGICGGDNNTCLDCAGVPNGAARYDLCGECNGANACVGCDGVPGSGKVWDACGICGGDGSTCRGCDGVANSGKSFDRCGACLSRWPTKSPDWNKCLDCNGVPNGVTKLDKCNVCGGSNACIGCDSDEPSLNPKRLDRCGVCGGNDECVGCDGVANSGAVIDSCGICGGTNECFDCSGKRGNLKLDQCGKCGGDGTSCMDCKGNFFDPDAGQKPTVELDRCLVCGGNDECVGCDDIPYSGKNYDKCGLCSGNDACVDCEGVIDGDKVLDRCGICGGDDACVGCDGVKYSGIENDCCGKCGGDGSTCTGCDGVCNSGQIIDQKGVCGGSAWCDNVANSGKQNDRCGECGGEDACVGCDNKVYLDSPPPKEDRCGVCDGNDACVDCADVVRGTATYDRCGVCQGSDACVDCDGVVNGPNRPDDCDLCPSESGYNQKVCYGCDARPKSGKTYDQCGVCGGSNACLDCKGVPNGGAEYDGCGVCGGTGKEDNCGVCNGNNACCGCDGVCVGGGADPAKTDKCGVCGGKDACVGCDGIAVVGGIPKAPDRCDVCGGNDECLDCKGLPYGTAKADKCGVCGGSDSCVDCEGVVNGGAGEDRCGVCRGNDLCIGCDDVPYSNKELDACGVCGGDGSSCLGCDGQPNSGKVLDRCSVCGGNNACLDCKGVPNGNAIKDQCGVCDGDGQSCIGCDGVLNSGLRYDRCNECGGSDACVDCANVPFGDAKRDQCNVCQGTDACVDCKGIPNGGNLEDPFGVCGGAGWCDGQANSGQTYDKCGACGGGDSCVDCAGVAYGDSQADECGVCNGDNSSCAGCDGVPNSGLTYNSCGECADESTCIEFVRLRIETPGTIGDEAKFREDFNAGIAEVLRIDSGKIQVTSVTTGPSQSEVIIEFEIYASRGATRTPWALYQALKQLVVEGTFTASEGPAIIYAQDCTGQAITNQLDLDTGRFSMTQSDNECRIVTLETAQPVAQSSDPTRAPTYAPLKEGETRAPTTQSPTRSPLPVGETRAPADTATPTRPAPPPVPTPSDSPADRTQWSTMSVLVVLVNTAFALHMGEAWR